MDYHDVNFNNDFVYYPLTLLFMKRYKLYAMKKILMIEIDKKSK